MDNWWCLILGSLCHFVTLKHRTVYNNFQIQWRCTHKIVWHCIQGKSEVHLVPLIIFSIHKNMLINLCEVIIMLKQSKWNRKLTNTDFLQWAWVTERSIFIPFISTDPKNIGPLLEIRKLSLTSEGLTYDHMQEYKVMIPALEEILAWRLINITGVFKKDQFVWRIDSISRRSTLKVHWRQSQNSQQPTNPHYLSMHPSVHSTFATSLPVPGGKVSPIFMILWQSCSPKASTCHLQSFFPPSWCSLFC